MLALLSILLGKLCLSRLTGPGIARRIPVAAMTNARLFIILSASNAPFRNVFESPLTLLTVGSFLNRARPSMRPCGNERSVSLDRP